MVVELLATSALAAIAWCWGRDRRRLTARLLDDDVSRALPVNLALWWVEQEANSAELRSSRRVVLRIGVLGRLVEAPDDVTAGTALAAALPPGALRDAALQLPRATREALAYRHARWDGQGIPPGAAGDGIPLAGQLLSVAEWMEERDGASPSTLEAGLRDEAARRFSPRLALAAATHLRELLAVAPPEAHLGVKVTSGTMLCLTPALAGLPDSARGGALSELERRVRAKLRPSDRIYRTDRDVVAWLAHTGPDGASAVAERLRPSLEPGTDITFALADTDATSFADLLAVARERAGGGEQRRVG